MSNLMKLIDTLLLKAIWSMHYSKKVGARIEKLWLRKSDKLKVKKGKSTNK